MAPINQVVNIWRDILSHRGTDECVHCTLWMVYRLAWWRKQIHTQVPHLIPFWYPLKEGSRGKAWISNQIKKEAKKKKNILHLGLINQLPNIWSAHYFYWLSFCTLFLKAWQCINSAFKIKQITFYNSVGIGIFFVNYTYAVVRKNRSPFCREPSVSNDNLS